MSAAREAEAKTLDQGEIGKATILKDWYNPLIKRREIVMIIDHMLKPTPMRIVLRQALAEKFGVDIKRLYVREIKTEYGIGRSRVRVHVYDTPERALQFEPKHIIERNGGVDPFAGEG
jgi:small subunit ribosomal protein S24e